MKLVTLIVPIWPVISKMISLYFDIVNITNRGKTSQRSWRRWDGKMSESIGTVHTGFETIQHLNQNTTGINKDSILKESTCP